MPRGKPKKVTAEGGSQGAVTGYESELWAMADALRGSMDAADTLISVRAPVGDINMIDPPSSPIEAFDGIVRDLDYRSRSAAASGVHLVATRNVLLPYLLSGGSRDALAVLHTAKVHRFGC